MRPKSRTLLAALLLAAVAHALFATGVAAQGLTDTLSHQPPLTGPEPYSPVGTWLPGTGGFPAPGKTYVDPVFGTTIRRLTGMWPNPGDAALYAKNGFWNADGTRLAYSHSDTGTIHVTDTTTGQDVASGLPGYGSSEVNFDPNFPDVWYYGSGTQLRKYLLSTGDTVVVKDFGRGSPTSAARATWWIIPAATSSSISRDKPSSGTASMPTVAFPVTRPTSPRRPDHRGC